MENKVRPGGGQEASNLLSCAFLAAGPGLKILPDRTKSTYLRTFIHSVDYILKVRIFFVTLRHLLTKLVEDCLGSHATNRLWHGMLTVKVTQTKDKDRRGGMLSFRDVPVV